MLDLVVGPPAALPSERIVEAANALREYHEWLGKMVELRKNWARAYWGRPATLTVDDESVDGATRTYLLDDMREFVVLRDGISCSSRKRLREQLPSLLDTLHSRVLPALHRSAAALEVQCISSEPLGLYNGTWPLGSSLRSGAHLGFYPIV